MEDPIQPSAIQRQNTPTALGRSQQQAPQIRRPTSQANIFCWFNSSSQYRRIEPASLLLNATATTWKLLSRVRLYGGSGPSLHVPAAKSPLCNDPPMPVDAYGRGRGLRARWGPSPLTASLSITQPGKAAVRFPPSAVRCIERVVANRQRLNLGTMPFFHAQHHHSALQS